MMKASDSGFIQRLELERGEILDVGRLASAVERHDEGKADGDFGCGHGNDEKHHDLAVEVVVETGKGHEGEVGGVEHQLEAHVEDKQIAAEDDPEQAEGEEPGADEQ